MVVDRNEKEVVGKHIISLSRSRSLVGRKVLSFPGVVSDLRGQHR